MLHLLLRILFSNFHLSCWFIQLHLSESSSNVKWCIWWTVDQTCNLINFVSPWCLVREKVKDAFKLLLYLMRFHDAWFKKKFKIGCCWDVGFVYFDFCFCFWVCVGCFLAISRLGSTYILVDCVFRQITSQTSDHVRPQTVYHLNGYPRKAFISQRTISCLICCSSTSPLLPHEESSSFHNILLLLCADFVHFLKTRKSSLTALFQQGK